jgi:type IV pilus assembly protein PilE
MGRARLSGFTLIEVMIVVAVVAILGAIAFPSYQEHIRKSRRADCTVVMTTLAAALERRYSTTAPATYIGAPQIPVGLTTCPPTPGAGGAFYNLTLPGVTATTFTIWATPAGAQADDKCGTLTLTHAGVKDTSSGLEPRECW